MGNLKVDYNGKTLINTSVDNAYILNTSDKYMEDDVTLTASDLVSLKVTYNNSTNISQSNANGTWKMSTKGKYMQGDITISETANGVIDVGTITPISVARYCLEGANVGNYALAIGGLIDNNTPSSVVDVYNISLEHSTPPQPLSVARAMIVSSNVGNYTLAMGGSSSQYSSDYFYSTIDAYNSSLTRSSPTQSLSVARTNLAAASVGNYALAMGGETKSLPLGCNTVDAYNTSLVRSTPTNALSSERYSLSGLSFGNYALAIGGAFGNNTVDVYNTSLTRSQADSLSEGRSIPATTNVGNYALIAGGVGNSTAGSSVIDVYNASLTRLTPMNLGHLAPSPEAITVGGYAFIIYEYYVEIYDTSLTKISESSIEYSKRNFASAKVGNYALAMGGQKYQSYNYQNDDRTFAWKVT